MSRWRIVGATLAAAALVMALEACGGNSPTETCPAGTSGSPPNCTPIVVEQPCTQTVIDSGNGSANAFTIYRKDFSVPENGRLDMTVDWTVASSRIGVYVVPVHTCQIEDLNARNCTFLVRSEPGASTAKPLKISTANFAAGNYTWLIGNGSDRQESLAYQVVLSKGSSCPALAGAGPGASARPGGAGASVEYEQELPLP
jgi:hypothetical protein